LSWVNVENVDTVCAMRAISKKDISNLAFIYFTVAIGYVSY